MQYQRATVPNSHRSTYPSFTHPDTRREILNTKCSLSPRTLTSPPESAQRATERRPRVGRGGSDGRLQQQREEASNAAMWWWWWWGRGVGRVGLCKEQGRERGRVEETRRRWWRRERDGSRRAGGGSVRWIRRSDGGALGLVECPLRWITAWIRTSLARRMQQCHAVWLAG